LLPFFGTWEPALWTKNIFLLDFAAWGRPTGKMLRLFHGDLSNAYAKSLIVMALIGKTTVWWAILNFDRFLLSYSFSLSCGVAAEEAGATSIERGHR